MSKILKFPHCVVALAPIYPARLSSSVANFGYSWPKFCQFLKKLPLFVKIAIFNQKVPFSV